MIYTTQFYSAHQAGARRSAAEIVPMLMRWIAPRSMIDIGCGVGSWLSVFAANGVTDLAGVDGDWVQASQLEIPPSAFTAFDLRHVYRAGRTFDLAMSLEVAEHLPPECAGGFVETLCGLAPVILFSAAALFQGGTSHVNEQWPDYWVNLFAAHGYRVIDAIRRRVWSNPAVDWFYAQNAMLFATDEFLAAHDELRKERDAARGWPLALVHPTPFVIAQELHQRLHQVAAEIGAVVKRGEPFILVDEDEYRTLLTVGARSIPFLEKDGAYWGEPADDAVALAEFERLRSETGARYMIFLWKAFWWLEQYPALNKRLRSDFPTVVENDRLIAFELTPH